MTDPLHAESHAKRLLVQECFYLLGAERLNLIQFRAELEVMTLDELARLRADCFAELDDKFCTR